MKNKYKLLVVFIYLMAMSYLMSNLTDKDPVDMERSDSMAITENPTQLKSSGWSKLIWNITIDDFATGELAQNWTWAKAQDWFGGGVGNSTDPFLIENVTVTNSGTDFGISISNSNSTTYFRLNNVTIVNTHATGSGIILNNTYNGEILDSVCNSMKDSGIKLVTAINTTLTGNTLNLNNYGIHMYNVTSAAISTSDLINNTNTGIYVMNSTENIIGDTNDLTDNNNYGIYMVDSDDNEINKNTISSGNETGIAIVDCDNSIVYYNTISDNVDYGITIVNTTTGDSLENTIFRNDFDDNGINAVDNCSVANNWFEGTIGNDWDVFIGSESQQLDGNDDGIGDYHQDIPGSAGAEDEYPIFDDGTEPNPSFDDDDDDDAEDIADDMTDTWAARPTEGIAISTGMIVAIAAVFAGLTIVLIWYIRGGKKIRIGRGKKTGRGKKIKRRIRKIR